MPKPHRHVLRLLLAAMIPALLPAIATAAPMNASTADVAAAADTYPKPNSDPVLCPVAHSEKRFAAPTYKKGFGFHPLLCYLDGTDEAQTHFRRDEAG